MYTKPHFENMAKLIKKKNSVATNKEEFFAEIIKTFQADNSKFKLEKFLKASNLSLVNLSHSSFYFKFIVKFRACTHRRFYDNHGLRMNGQVPC